MTTTTYDIGQDVKEKIVREVTAPLEERIRKLEAAVFGASPPPAVDPKAAK